jgi:membrane protein implicated in regulation of membrane protease activity
MLGLSRGFTAWSEERPWLAAICAGVLLAAILAAIGLVLFDSPDWPFLLLLALTMTLAWGFKGQAQRRRRRRSDPAR